MIKKYVYETEIFESQKGTLNGIIISELTNIENKKMESIFSLREKKSIISSEISVLENMVVTARATSPNKDSTMAEAVKIYKKESIMNMNNDIRSAYRLIKHNQSLLMKLQSDFECDLLDANNSNPTYRCVLEKFQKIIISRINDLSNAIDALNIEKGNIRMDLDDGNINLDNLISLKRTELDSYNRQLDEHNSEKLLILLALNDVRTKSSNVATVNFDNDDNATI